MGKQTLNKRFTDAEKGFLFRVDRVNECPVYRKNDHFKLRDTMLYPPAGKPTCLPLTTHLLVNRSILDKESVIPDISFSCDGCGENKTVTITTAPEEKLSEKEERLVALLHQFSFFKFLRTSDIRELIPELKLLNREVGDTILTKGEPGKALYIIISGKVEILPDENSESITNHGVGTVFGEISLLSGELCNATVRAIEPTQLLSMRPERFKEMIHHFPKLQKYFFQLLAQRLDKTNMATVRGGAQIQGNLQDWKLPEILQTLNMNQKSGTLSIEVADLDVEVLFSFGQICRVIYSNLASIDGFFELFRLTEGPFTFHPHKGDDSSGLEPIGDFMHLMVEGMVRTDEINM